MQSKTCSVTEGQVFTEGFVLQFGTDLISLDVNVYLGFSVKTSLF